VAGFARRVLDADGAVVAPGFIDLHTHVDFTIRERPDAPSMVRQGVTTVVVGNCGFSAFPVPAAMRERVADWAAFLSARPDLLFEDAGGFLEAFDRLPLVPNVAALAGHGTLRLAVMGDEARAPSEPELAAMEALLDEALRAGATGLSAGLIYEPGRHAARAELERLAAVVARHGGFLATHLRDEGEGLLAALEEVVGVAEATSVSAHVSHLKAAGPRAAGLVVDALARIAEAHGRGLDVTADQYPYTASSTKLAAVAGGGGGLMDPFDPALVLIGHDPAGRWTGRTLADVAAAEGQDPRTTLAALVASRGDGVQVVLLDRMAEADVCRVLADPDVAVASDGWSLSGSAGRNPHPRSFGTFARVLGRYARDEGVLSLPVAVRKMTAVPAGRLGMPDRGRLAPGAAADVVVLDPQRVDDRATYERPYEFATGVRHVLVAGEAVVEAGEPTGAAPGRALRRLPVGWQA
jgi:N-acyl-D-amino-acid deacylase